MIVTLFWEESGICKDNDPKKCQKVLFPNHCAFEAIKDLCPKTCHRCKCVDKDPYMCKVMDKDLCDLSTDIKETCQLSCGECGNDAK